jgi:hypothetical protein
MPDDKQALRIKMVEHLEADQGIADTTGDGETSYLERALYQAKSDLYPTLDPLIDLRPKK